jgi:hypothetical protein
MADKHGKTAFLQAAKAVFWSFLGIRRRAQHAEDLAKLGPVPIIIAGLAGAVVFVLVLVALAHFIVGQAT